ncbi:MAG: NAD(P)H-hydrate dehydratase [Planctomycetota bacterium]
MNPPFELPPRDSAGHKGNYGRVLLIGGSRGMAGSIALSSIAALHTGSGLVTAVVPDSILETVAGFHPAVMTLPSDDASGQFGIAASQSLATRVRSADAIGCGPGMRTGVGAIRIVDCLLHQRQRLVLDADALNIIAMQDWIPAIEANRSAADMVWTPHAGELARLTGVPADQPDAQVRATEELCHRTQAVVVIKGGPTQVIGLDSSGEIQRWTNSTGNPGMATAGCGDVLTGVITSLLGQGLSAWDAARLGVWLHGHAGDRAVAATSTHGMTASHLVEMLASCGDAITRCDQATCSHQTSA